MNSTGNRFVHFGDAEDILFTSFLREDEEAEKIPSEEERKAEEVKNRLVHSRPEVSIDFARNIPVYIY